MSTIYPDITPEQERLILRKHWAARAREPENRAKYYKYRSKRLEQDSEFRERVNEYARKYYANRRERLQNDPEYKAETQAKRRAYYQRKKAESNALKDLIP